MKWTKQTDGFNRIYWFSGNFEISIQKFNKEYPYALHHKETGYSYYDGDFKTLKSAKQYAESIK